MSLPTDVSRCRGIHPKDGHICERRETCRRFTSIAEDRQEVMVPPAAFLCMRGNDLRLPFTSRSCMSCRGGNALYFHMTQNQRTQWRCKPCHLHQTGSSR